MLLSVSGGSPFVVVVEVSGGVHVSVYDTFVVECNQVANSCDRTIPEGTR